MKALVAIRSDRQAACATWTAVSHCGMRVLAGAGGNLVTAGGVGMRSAGPISARTLAARLRANISRLRA